MNNHSRFFLVSHGNAGLLVPCRSMISWQRHDEVMVRTSRGLEPGTIRSPWRLDSDSSLGSFNPGDILGAMTDDFRGRWTQACLRAEKALSEAQRWTEKLRLPLEVIDVEPVLEPFALILHLLQTAKADPRDLVSRLSKSFAAPIHIHDLTQPMPEFNQEDDCGSCHSESGGCSTDGCGSGCASGCASGCGTQGSDDFERDWQAYFAALRTKMENRKISLPM